MKYYCAFLKQFLSFYCLFVQYYMFLWMKIRRQNETEETIMVQVQIFFCGIVNNVCRKTKTMSFVCEMDKRVETKKRNVCPIHAKSKTEKHSKEKRKLFKNDHKLLLFFFVSVPLRFPYESIHVQKRMNVICVKQRVSKKKLTTREFKEGP